GLLAEIDKDGSRFEQRQRFARWPIGIYDRRDFSVRVERQELGRPALVLGDVDIMRLVGKTYLLEHDGYFHSIRRLRRIELQSIGVLGRPALGDGKGGKIGHGSVPGLF